MKFYVNQDTRMVRTLADEDEPAFKLWQPGNGGWAQVSEAAFNQFRDQTLKKFSVKTLKLIRAGMPWLWLGPEPNPDDQKLMVWLLSPPDQIGYVGPISKTKRQAQTWAKELGFLTIKLETPWQ